MALFPLITNESSQDLLNLSLRLLLNLSFDSDLRSIMMEAHLVPPVAKFASADNDTVHRQVARCLLYQLSRDERARSLLSYTDAFPILVNQALNCRDRIPIELNALLINAALSRPNATLLVEHNKGKTCRSLARVIKNQKNISITSFKKLQ